MTFKKIKSKFSKLFTVSRNEIYMAANEYQGNKYFKVHFKLFKEIKSLTIKKLSLILRLIRK